MIKSAKILLVLPVLKKLIVMFSMMFASGRCLKFKRRWRRENNRIEEEEEEEEEATSAKTERRLLRSFIENIRSCQ